MQEKEINISVELDDNDVPEKMTWNATDLSGKKEAACRAMLLAMWDYKNQDTLRLDLWTKQMNKDEMKTFFYQTLLTMADTLETATEEIQIAEDMRDFASYFGDKMDVQE